MKSPTESPQRTVTVHIPMRLVSLANQRMHWRALARLKKEQKAFVSLYLPRDLPALPATVTLTRIGKRTLDGDNLQACAKYVRDAIADAFGVDDGSDLYEWKYEQKTGKEYGVEILIESVLRDAKCL